MSERFDIVVVGAGPAGIAAAVTAAEAGLRVALVDDNPAAGGQIWRSGAPLPRAARQWTARLRSSSTVRLQGWRVFDSPQPGVLRAERSGAQGNAEPMELRFAKLILATGARERFLPFPGWTLPNVMGAGALDAMVRGGLPIEGRRVVIAGTGPLLLAVAAHLRARGARILAVCEQAPLRQWLPLAAQLARHPAKLWQAARYRRAAGRLLTNCRPVAALGGERLEAVVLRRGARPWQVACDYLACGFHLVPNTELAALLGCRLDNGFVATDETLRTSVPEVFCAGEPTGIGGVELALLEGRIAALAASGSLRKARTLARQRAQQQGFVRALERACALSPALREMPGADTLVCRCEDVPLAALRGCAGWRDAKLRTRCGMGPCQGRVCGPATEFLLGWNPGSVRPPLFPALVSSLAGPEPAADTISGDRKEMP